MSRRLVYAKLACVLLVVATVFLPVKTPGSEAIPISRIEGGVQSAYQAITTLRLRFVQTTQLELLGKNMVKHGEMLLARPGKFRIRYTTPPLKEYISDGRRLWIYAPEENLVQETVLDKASIDAQAKVFLDGLGHLTEAFLVSPLSREQGKQAMFAMQKSQVYLQLIPREESSFYEWVALAVDPSTYLVRELTIVNRSKNVSHYRFEQIEKNPALADSQFNGARAQ